jgi:hypothetical protein
MRASQIHCRKGFGDSGPAGPLVPARGDAGQVAAENGVVQVCGMLVGQRRCVGELRLKRHQRAEVEGHAQAKTEVRVAVAVVAAFQVFSILRTLMEEPAVPEAH